MDDKRAFRDSFGQLQALENFLIGIEEDVSEVPQAQVEAALRWAGINATPLLTRVRGWIAAGQAPRADTIHKEGAMSREETLMERYNDAFNRHDIEAVLACFDEQATVVMPHGRRIEGVEAIRQYYASIYATFEGAKCTIRTVLGDSGTGSLETLFTGTRGGVAQPMRMLGTEVFTFQDDRIIELRLYAGGSE